MYSFTVVTNSIRSNNTRWKKRQLTTSSNLPGFCICHLLDVETLYNK